MLAGQTVRLDLPSFPTRRSSDLDVGIGNRRQREQRGATQRLDDEKKERRRIQGREREQPRVTHALRDRKSTRVDSSHLVLSYADLCLNNMNAYNRPHRRERRRSV